MKILILPDPDAAAARVADIIARTLVARPEAVLGLATGGTMEPVYARLVAQARSGQVALDRMTGFNLDEYVGLPPRHPQSYHAFMRAHLAAPAGLDPARLNLPRGDAPDAAAEAARYEAAIAASGGIDLQLLGLGANGHIGFNEPSSSLASPTRVKTLNHATRAANARFFGPGEEVPRHAITMGIATILRARHALLLATGAHKAQAVAAMVEGPVSARCPASALQMHPAATIVLDAAAAAKLELRDYYETVHPEGREPCLA
ncbi:glucosamine-6-phosphate deaminase [Limimaricola pyoseonensis]|uniref:Glucosamine-6-phosphate deaminase n=1 Tax=Limimaricola pyoseonensis TaxID=521013 RepID=A0A1G7HQH8_9RHOB|nr:glucosamine-6-phosphate deaminase [Limimaricola pyoseonensis]SDF02673.1 glucosamine-6-phosphate deaminase [Limimaricola pyoseonensis]